MLFNYIKIAFRNLTRNTVYSFINIGGLALGLTCSILISLWVINEITYDKFNTNIDQLFQVWAHTKFEGRIETRGSTPMVLQEELKKHSQIKNVAISQGASTNLLSVNEKKFNKWGKYVSPEFLEMFQFELIKGQAESVLDDPLSIVLTESTAKTLFGDVEPINKIVRIDNKTDVKVTGILKDLPGNSSFQFDYLLTMALFESTTEWVKDCKQDWGCDWFRVHVELKPGADLESINEAIKGISKKKDQESKTEFFLYPMNRWHLHGYFENGKEADSDASDYVYGFSALAILIIAIAGINFMNLSTARSERRAREVGIRKISGSLRKDLVVQFLGESVLIAFLAFLFSLVLVELLLPLYNELVDEKLYINFSSPLFWFISLAIVLVTGIFSGSYPAFFLSSFNPVKVLKGKLQAGRTAIFPRKVLVVVQFIFSISLIIVTIVVYNQIQFAKERQLGYDKQNLITVSDNEELAQNYQAIKQNLIDKGLATSIVKTNSPITDIYEVNYLEWPGNPANQMTLTNIFTGYDYCKTMGIKLVQGRDFSPEFATDSTAVILNQSAIDLMGLEEPIGTEVSIGGDKLKIIGVTEDVVMTSPYEPVDPMYIKMEKEWIGLANQRNITIRLSDIKNLEKVKDVFKKYNPNFPFEFVFVDEEFNRKFSSLSLIAKLTNVFAFLAIVIACLGLFGLAAFTAEQRKKELGIRKVLGANLSSLVILISQDFSKLIVIAFFMACPLVWWTSTNFLEQYAYHISFNWWTLPITGSIVLLLSLGIVCTQALKAALSNPVESLKND